ncbi:MAG: MATE family efflux transporter [bacterium]
MQHSLTEGSILKAIFRISWPVAMANILQTVYNLTDIFWVGRVGQEAVAAVSFSFPILFLLISFGAGISIAGTILVAQYKGKGAGGIDYIASQTLLILGVISILISAAGYMLTPFLINLTGAEPAVIPGAVAYLKVSFVGLIFLFSFFVFQSILRGVGVVKIPMFIVLGTVILNFLADPIFIMGWGPIPAYGVAGAAMATIITEGLAAAIALSMFLSGKYGIKLRLVYFKPDWPLTKKLLLLGLPASVEHSIRAFSFTVMIFLVGAFGTTVVASYGIVTRILSFIIIPAVGVAMATTTLVGQNIGAGKPDRAARTAAIAAGLTFVLMTAAGAMFYIFSGNLISFFIPGDPYVIETGSLFIKIVSLTFGFAGLQIVLGGAFRGSGNTVAAMLFTLASFLIIRIGLAYGLSNYSALSEKGIWWAFPLSNLTGGLLALFWFLKGSWMKKRLVDEINLTYEIMEESLP